jgi:DNA-binding NarL/FixJ family response regulator
MNGKKSLLKQLNKHVALSDMLKMVKQLAPEAYQEDFSTVAYYPLLDSILAIADCTLFITSAGADYVYMSPTCEDMTGFTPQEFMQGGYHFFIKLVNTEDHDRIFLGAKLFYDVLNQTPLEQRKSVVAMQHYRVKRKNGEEMMLLIRAFILDMDSSGKMVHLLNIGTDITGLKKMQQDNIIVSIANYDNHSTVYTYNDTKEVEVHQQFLSDREVEIIKLLQQQLSSKEIAERLFVSPHTIDTHRRNLLEKTNTKDTTALVTYASLMGWV